jgi:Leucine-rich repeat (LRR) protein
VNPEPLQSVPNEPVLPPSEPTKASRKGNREQPSWFQAQDLTVLKVGNNEIEEIQHEISLFGSLKTVDVSNRFILRLISCSNS